VSERRRPDSPARTGVPAPLLVAASLVAVEGVLVVLLAVLELRSLDAERASMAITTAVFFLGYGALLLACARSVTRGHSWARSPVVLAQLIQLGVAWNYRSSPTTLLAVGLAVVAVVVIAGLLHPASVEALADRPDGPDGG
jgi:hypothetical protein